MGALSSRQNAGVEEVDISVNHAYRYPPKTGNYFSNHFIMGGERFDTAQPEMYLFGENSDLNFLGSRPAPFPYPAPSASEPSRTLKALVNIRKESLRFVRVPDDSLSLKEPEIRSSTQFNIEFTFDCDIRCAITIMYFCTEEVSSSGLIYTPKDPSMNSETFHYKRGANQQFSQVCHVFDPSQYPEENLQYTLDRDVIPIVIYCIAEEGDEPLQSHATIAIVEKHSDGYVVKPLKQKLFVDGLCYLLQEIYGIENKTVDNVKAGTDEDPDDNGAECVICMCDLRDTLILPCRHLCLCNCCADSLRYQANNCPICRAPFRALLQIKALQKSTGLASGNNTSANISAPNSDGIPPGYEAVSLIEALNGPSVIPQQAPVPPYQSMYVPLPQNALDGPLEVPLDNPRGFQEASDLEHGKGARPSALEDSTTQTERPQTLSDTTDSLTKGSSGSVQMRLSVLMAQEAEDAALGGVPGEVPSPSHSASKKKKKPKTPKEDSVTCINETAVAKSRDSYESAPKKTRSRKSSASSPNEVEIAETNLCINDQDDIEELTETLSLLDDLKVEDKISSPNEAPAVMKPSGSISSLSTGIETSSAAQSASVPAEDDPAFVTYFEDGKDFYYIQPGIRRGSSKRSKQMTGRSSRKGREGTTNTSSELADQDDLSVPHEVQSLPGTPLSTSSAVSRTSDASMSSASSTRALIVAQPTPLNYDSNGN